MIFTIAKPALRKMLCVLAAAAFLTISIFGFNVITFENGAIEDAWNKFSLPISHYSEARSEYAGLKRHRNMYLYNAVVEPKHTCNDDTYILIGVITSPESSYHREVYRSTILSPLTNGSLTGVSYVFLLGLRDDHSFNLQLYQEMHENDDIIIGNFSDTYENLSLKSLFLLHWGNQKCSSAKFIYKLDDDVFANLVSIFNYLKSASYSHYSLLGNVFTHVTPIRDEMSKWHIDPCYTRTEYPTYVAGPSYVVSKPLVGPIIQAALRLPLLRLEDVFITGLSAEATNLSIEYIEVAGFNYNVMWYPGMKLDDLKTIHKVNTEQLKAMWTSLFGS